MAVEMRVTVELEICNPREKGPKKSTSQMKLEMQIRPFVSVDVSRVLPFREADLDLPRNVVFFFP